MTTERRATNVSDTRPGTLDHVCFMAADKMAFFVGELDTKPVSCISVVKHSENYAYVGQFCVDEDHCGRGYGSQLWSKALAMASAEKCNVGLAATPHMEHKFEKNGFKRTWMIKRFDFVALEAANALSVIPDNPATRILPVSEAHFNDILKYDTAICAFSRRRFLEKWLFSPNRYAYVAIGDEGRVVGYVVIRTTIKEGTWRIGPLFANDSLIAKHFYKTVFNKIAADNPTAIMSADMPYYGDGVNEGVQQIVLELSGVPKLTFARMYTQGVPPNLLLEKIFAHTALEIY